MMAKLKIAIDAGHGSNTDGKRTPPFLSNTDIDKDGTIDVKKGEQYREHYANVGVANLLYHKLVARGYQVIKTGWNDENGKDDPDEALSSRQKKIRDAGCDISISIHFNAYGDGKSFNSVEGVGIYIHNTQDENSRLLADFVLTELLKGTKQVNRGITKQALAMCNCNIMKTEASILCELAYMTNANEGMKLMANCYFWEECAEEIANGVERYSLSSTKESITPKNQVTTQYYTVVKGDTLTKIATNNNTSVNSLIALNKLKDPNKLSPGQKLILSEYRVYTVKSGDSLHSISSKQLGQANRYPEIMTLNYMTTQIIYVNQVLKIPAK